MIPNVSVPDKYRKTFFIATQYCSGFGDDTNCASLLTANWMSGRVSVRYWNDSMILLYSIDSVIGDSSENRSCCASIGVVDGFKFVKLQLSNKFTRYCCWDRNRSLFVWRTWMPRKNDSSPSPSAQTYFPIFLLLLRFSFWMNRLSRYHLRTRTGTQFHRLEPIGIKMDRRSFFWSL